MNAVVPRVDLAIAKLLQHGYKGDLSLRVAEIGL